MKKAQKRIPVLERLAKEMQVLGETEQRRYIGGTFYYDYNGSFLGSVGSGNDVKIGNSVIDANAISLSSANEETLGKVLSTIGNAIGIGDVNISHENEGNFGSHNQGQVSFNFNSLLKQYNNYYDYLAVLYHEKSHQMTYQSGSGGSASENELQALKYEMGQEIFQNTSDFLKSTVLKQIFQLSGSSGSPELFDTGWFYTKDNYLDLLEDGQWNGGYVIGMGYMPIAPDGATIIGSSGSGSGSDDSGSSDSGTSGSSGSYDSGSYGSSGNYGY